MRMVLIIGVASVALFLQVATCQQADVIQQWDFEEDVEGWMSIDPLGELGRTEAEGAVYGGQGALQFTFPQRVPEGMGAQDGIPGAIVAAIDADTTDLKSVSFTAGTTYSTPLVVSLNEEDESSYAAFVWSEAGKWNETQLALSDFHLSDDSADENGRLDTEQISTFALADASLLGRMLEHAGLPFVGPPPVEMTVFLDDVQLSAAEPVFETDADKEEVVIDRCNRPTIQWMPLGGEELSLTTEQDAGGGEDYLRVQYLTQPGSLFALLRRVEVGSLDGCVALSVQLRSELDTTVVIAVEQSEGGRFNKAVQVNGGPEWHSIEVPLAKFEPDQDSGAVGTVNPAKIKQVSFADVKAMTEQTISANTWHIRNLIAVTAQAYQL